MTGVYDVGDLEQIKKYNSIEIDEDHRIMLFRRETAGAEEHADRHRALLLSESVLPLIHQYICRGKQSGSTGPPGPMALSARTLLRLEGAGPLVRCRFNRNARRGESRFSKTDKMFQDCRIELVNPEKSCYPVHKLCHHETTLATTDGIDVSLHSHERSRFEVSIITYGGAITRSRSRSRRQFRRYRAWL